MNPSQTLRRQCTLKFFFINLNKIFLLNAKTTQYSLNLDVLFIYSLKHNTLASIPYVQEVLSIFIRQLIRLMPICSPYWIILSLFISKTFMYPLYLFLLFLILIFFVLLFTAENLWLNVLNQRIIVLTLNIRIFHGRFIR